MRLGSFHRILGLILFVLILNAAFTGLLRANAQWWYWKKKPSMEAVVSLSRPAVSLEQVFKTCETYFPSGAKICRVELKSLSGKQVYVVEVDRQGKRYLLVDADSGEVISPLNCEFATRIARSLVHDNNSVVLAESLPAFRTRKMSQPRPVFRILFNDALKTEVIVDRDTGEPLMILDRGRRFGLWVVKLHDLDFIGMSRVALTLLGISIVSLSFTGLLLSLRSRKRL